MKRLLPLMFALLALAVLAAPISASNHQSGTPTTKQDCEEAGGTWVNNRGEKSCIIVTPVFGDDFQALTLPEDVPWDTSTTVGVNLTPQRMQKGAIGAPGTSDTYRETVECRAVDEEGNESRSFDGDVCDSIYEQVSSDDDGRS